MMDGITLHLTLFCCLAYLSGSIPFGLILSKLFLGQDIRKTGSGNIGATNVLRSGNKLLAITTLLLDVFKAVIIIGISIYISAINNFYVSSIDRTALMSPITISVIVGLFAIIGHCFPIWLKFKGGKGVATALGVLLAAVPYAGFAACATWLVTAKITKFSSLSALIALAVAPIVTAFVYGLAPASVCALITLLIWLRHKDNIKRLLNGTESKIGAKKKTEDDSKEEEVPIEPVSK